MAKRISRDFLETFVDKLESTEEWKSEVNLRELVETAFFSIEKARERKATWEQIAAILQESVGDNIEVKADTIRQYYLDASKNRAALMKKKRRQAAAKTTRTSEPPYQPIKSSNTRQSHEIETLTKQMPDPSDEETNNSESSFNLRKPRR